MNDLHTLAVPFLSAVLGGVVSFIGGFLAMRIELAVLRTRVESLSKSLDGMRENIDEAHRRVDAWYMPR